MGLTIDQQKDMISKLGGNLSRIERFVSEIEMETLALKGEITHTKGHLERYGDSMK